MKEENKLFIVNEGGKTPVYNIAVYAKDEKEAVRIAREYMKTCDQVLFPKLPRILVAHEVLNKEVLNKD